uniref:Transposase (Putative), gypsy type n=1 Tax=Tanacetum cinerariifolium TaxID=118510 RepID=A0A6L2LJK7_TANCI|nr:hypothetical protein [Tanacetum cinerariifolium]
MGRDTVQLETTVSTISQEYLLKFTSEYDVLKALHPKLPSPGERIVDFPEGNGGCLSARDRGKIPSILYQTNGFPKNWNNRFFWVDERVFPTIMDWRTSAPKDEMPAENTYSPEAVMILNTYRTPIQKQPEALLCLVGLSRRYFLGDEVYPTFLHDDDRGGYRLVQFDSCSKPYQGARPRAAHEVPLLTATTSRVIEMEDLVVATDSSGEAVAPEVPPLENVTTTGLTPEAGQAEGIAAMGPYSTHGGKSLATIGLGMGSTHPVPASRGVPVDVSDPNLLSFADPQSRPITDVAQSSKGAAAAEDPESENTSFTSMDLMDHIAPPGYFLELRHLHNDDFLNQYNVNLARKVAMGSQLRLRFEQEAKLLKKSVAQVAHRDKRIQAREIEINNLETLLEAETDMKKTAEGKSAELSKKLENLRALFSDLQVIGHGLHLAVMKCGESTELRQVFIDVVSAEIAKGMSEGLKYGVEYGKANLSLEAIEAYDTEAEAKYIMALHALKDLKYPIVDQLESLKDAPMDARDPTDPWACKKEMLLADAIAANVSRAKKKKKYRVVCRTHGVGSAHHARSYGVPVYVPTVAPQGLAILLADAATQTEISEDGASPRVCTGSVLCAPWDSLRTHPTSLQPVYATCLL